MLPNKRIFIVLSVVITAFLSLWAFPGSQVDAKLDSPLPTPIPTSTLSKEAQIALRYFSENTGISMDKLHVGNPAFIQYPLTAKKLWQATEAIRKALK